MQSVLAIAAAVECLAQESAAMPGLALQLRVNLVLTDDAAKARKDWSESKETPPIRTISNVKPGDEVTTVTLFDGCQANAAGNCEVSVAFSLEVDGVRSDVDGGLLWSGKPLKGKMMLGTSGLTILVGRNWPLGRHLLHATVTDHVASVAIDVAVPFELED